MKTKTKTKKKKLTKNQMRVAIAKDVLAQMKAKKIIADVGTWMHDPKMGFMDEYVDYLVDEFIEDPSNDSCEFTEFHARDYTSKVKNCQVCALGSMFISAVNLYDDIKFKADDACASAAFEDLDKSPLKKYFSVHELKIIEAAFEGNDGCHFDDLSGKDAAVAFAYHEIFKTHKDRLSAIMKNIIRNNGVFKPDQEITKESLIERLSEVI